MKVLVLHLVLKKKWFDMIARGEKKEEYRKMCDHWKKRLTTNNELHPESQCRNFDVVTFQHGYATDAPRITLECGEIAIGTGRADWGAEPGKEYFVIKLGEII